MPVLLSHLFGALSLQRLIILGVTLAAPAAWRIRRDPPRLT
jgi:hypothetical protein